MTQFVTSCSARKVLICYQCRTLYESQPLYVILSCIQDDIYDRQIQRYQLSNVVTEIQYLIINNNCRLRNVDWDKTETKPCLFLGSLKYKLYNFRPEENLHFFINKIYYFIRLQFLCLVDIKARKKVEGFCIPLSKQQFFSWHQLLAYITCIYA